MQGLKNIIIALQLFFCLFLLVFFKAIRPQAARHIVPGDCFITTSISKGVVPEMVTLSVLQHQMPKFRIKHGKFHKETTHTPSIHLFLSKMFIRIQGLIK